MRPRDAVCRLGGGFGPAAPGWHALRDSGYQRQSRRDGTPPHGTARETEIGSSTYGSPHDGATVAIAHGRHFPLLSPQRPPLTIDANLKMACLYRLPRTVTTEARRTLYRPPRKQFLDHRLIVLVFSPGRDEASWRA